MAYDSCVFEKVDTYTFNEKLARDVLARIEKAVKDYEDGQTEFCEWDQGDWAQLHWNSYTDEQMAEFVRENPYKPACGTSFCFAGFVIDIDPTYVLKFEKPVAGIGPYWAVLKADDKTLSVPISAAAQGALQLSLRRAERLFSAGNTLQDLRNLVDLYSKYPHHAEYKCDMHGGLWCYDGDPALSDY